MVEETRVIKVFESFILGKCRCGCNKDIKIREVHGCLLRYFYNHHRKGKKPSNWKGGRYLSEHGYWFVQKPNHPNANKKGYIFEHRYVFQEHYKCCLLKWCKIHHINGNIQDNRIENLQPMRQSAHILLHLQRKVMPGRNCLACGSNRTYINRQNIPYWHKFEDGFLCEKCFKNYTQIIYQNTKYDIGEIN